MEYRCTVLCDIRDIEFFISFLIDKLLFMFSLPHFIHFLTKLTMDGFLSLTSSSRCRLSSCSSWWTWYVSARMLVASVAVERREGERSPSSAAGAWTLIYIVSTGVTIGTHLALSYDC